MILSISLILLISLSLVSAGFWDWLNGDVTARTGASAGLPTRTSGGDSGTSSRTSFARFGASGNCPNGWTSTEAAGDGSCCVKGEKSAIGGVMSPPRKNPKI